MAEIRAIALEAIERAGPEGHITFTELNQYLAAEVRATFAAIVLSEPPAFGRDWEEQHRHFAEAQLLQWPLGTAASCTGFGNTVLAIEECIAAYSVAYCRSASYPEDIPVFTELGEASAAEVALAARFVQSYLDLYTDQLGAAASYVSSELEGLVR